MGKNTCFFLFASVDDMALLKLSNLKDMTASILHFIPGEKVLPFRCLERDAKVKIAELLP